MTCLKWAITDALELEEDGVMTVKFKDAVSAQACVIRMNDRFFDGRRVGSVRDQTDKQISATIYNGKEKFSRSGKGDVLGKEAEGQPDNVDAFAQQLVDGSDEE